jgi:hypothetical protein
MAYGGVSATQLDILAARWCYLIFVMYNRASYFGLCWPCLGAHGTRERRQRACGPPLLSRPLPASQEHERTTALWFSLLSTARQTPAGGEACVRAYSVLGAGRAHVGQARDFVFVEVAPCPCGQPLAYAVPLV